MNVFFGSGIANGSGQILGGAVATPLSTLLAALGGTSHVNFIYDAKQASSLTIATGTSTTGTVSQWDDARGAGVSPALLGIKGAGAYPAVANGKITTDGSQNSFARSVPDYNLSLANAQVFVGQLNGFLNVSPYDTTGNAYGGYQVVTSAARLNNTLSLSTASGTTDRLSLISYTAAGTYGAQAPTQGERFGYVQGRITAGYVKNYNSDGGSWVNRSSKLFVGGLRPDFAFSYATSVQLWLAVDHPLTNTEYAAVKAYCAAMGHTYTSDDTDSKMVICDGNSITAGLTQTSYPTQLGAAAGLSGVYVVGNFGVQGRNGTTQLSSWDWRMAPLFTGNETKKFYLCWEVGNDIVNLSLTGAQAAQNVIDMCAKAKALGATKTIAIGCTPRSNSFGTGTSFEVARLAANAILSAAAGGAAIDLFYDPSLFAELQTTSNTTYYLDGIHMTTVGYGIVVNGNAGNNGLLSVMTPYL